MNPTIICGAGIAGVSAAYHLAVKHGIPQVILVDERAPLSLTSDQSSECYRNWFPGPGDDMVNFINRSIDIMECLADESGNTFQMNRRGYLFCTSRPEAVPKMQSDAQEISSLGAGPLRIHTSGAHKSTYFPSPLKGYQGLPDGADLLLGSEIIRNHFPYLNEEIIAALHIRRAGWFSAQQMGMYLLDAARQHGVQFINDRLVDVEVSNNSVSAVLLRNAGRLPSDTFINAAGPFINEIGGMLGVEFPVFHELHIKAAIIDSMGAFPRSATMTIFKDPVLLDWSEEERQFLMSDPDLNWLLEKLPPGLHFRPEGDDDSQIVLMLWEYQKQKHPPQFPIHIDPKYTELCLRGLTRFMPSVQPYLERLPQPNLDGGYYTKTPENRPIIDRLPVEGAFIIGALSGYGLMAACAAGELLAAYVTGDDLPAYAAALSLKRYRDPDYQALLANWDADAGQI